MQENGDDDSPSRCRKERKSYDDEMVNNPMVWM